MATLNPINATTTAFDAFDLDDEGEPVTTTTVAPRPATLRPLQEVEAVEVPTPTKSASNPLLGKKYAVEFDYKDGIALVADKAGWQIRANKKVSVGSSIIIDVESWEPLWMVIPGTDKAPKELVAYSRDGLNCNNSDQGTLAEHLAMLKSSGYDKARIEERVLVFGFYEGSEKAFPAGVETPEYVQIDLSPTSTRTFHSYMEKLHGSIRRGTVPTDKAAVVKFTITVEENKKKSNATYAAVNCSCPHKVVSVNRQLMIG